MITTQTIKKNSTHDASPPEANPGEAGGTSIDTQIIIGQANNKLIAPQVRLALHDCARPVSAGQIATLIGAETLKVEAVLDGFYAKEKCGRYTEGGTSYYYIPRNRKNDYIKGAG